MQALRLLVLDVFFGVLVVSPVLRADSGFYPITFVPPNLQSNVPGGTKTFSQTATQSTLGASLSSSSACADEGVEWQFVVASTDPSRVAPGTPVPAQLTVTTVSGFTEFTLNGSFFSSPVPAQAATYNVTLAVGRLYVFDVFAFVFASGANDNGCGFAPPHSSLAVNSSSIAVTLTLGNNCAPATVTIFSSSEGTTMQAAFTPDGGISLSAAASACGFIGFNWRQTVDVSPSPGGAFAVSDRTTPLVAPPPFSDPPLGGYTYQETDPRLNFTPNNAYPYYYDPGAPATYPLSLLANETSTTLSFFDAPATNLAAGQEFQFTTALVGMLPGTVLGPDLVTWHWTDTFDGISQEKGASVQTYLPVVPGSGTGGITVTSISGITQVPPRVNCQATPTVLWPPDGQSVLVTVKGSITSGTQGLNPGTAKYVVVDKYGIVQPSGSVALDSSGTFSFGVPLSAARYGDDSNGRTYTITISVRDNIGNLGSCPVIITVPHDQGN